MFGMINLIHSCDIERILTLVLPEIYCCSYHLVITGDNIRPMTAREIQTYNEEHAGPGCGVEDITLTSLTTTNLEGILKGDGTTLCVASAADLPSHAATHSVAGSDVLAGYMIEQGFSHDVLAEPDCAISYNSTIRKCTLAKGDSPGFTNHFFLNGIKHTFNTPEESDAHPDLTGEYYFIYDGSLSQYLMIDPYLYNWEIHQIIASVSYSSHVHAGTVTPILPKMGHEKFSPTEVLPAFTVKEAIDLLANNG